MIDNTVVTIVNNHLATSKPSDWDLDALESKFIEVYDQKLPDSIKKLKNIDNVYDVMFDVLKERYDAKVEELGRRIWKNWKIYNAWSSWSKWRQNLKDLTELREGINLQSYGQKNPVNEYKISSPDVYNDMIDGINRETTAFLLRLKFNIPEEEEKIKKRKMEDK